MGKVREWIPSSGTTSKIIDLEPALFVHALLLLASSLQLVGPGTQRCSRRGEGQEAKLGQQGQGVS